MIPIPEFIKSTNRNTGTPDSLEIVQADAWPAVEPLILKAKLAPSVNEELIAVGAHTLPISEYGGVGADDAPVSHDCSQTILREDAVILTGGLSALDSVQIQDELPSDQLVVVDLIGVVVGVVNSGVVLWPAGEDGWALPDEDIGDIDLLHFNLISGLKLDVYPSTGQIDWTLPKADPEVAPQGSDSRDHGDDFKTVSSWSPVGHNRCQCHLAASPDRAGDCVDGIPDELADDEVLASCEDEAGPDVPPGGHAASK